MEWSVEDHFGAYITSAKCLETPGTQVVLYKGILYEFYKTPGVSPGPKHFSEVVEASE